MLVRDSLLRVFIGGWSRGHPLPGTFRKARLQEGKQVFYIERIVCDKQFRYCQLPLPVVNFFPSEFRLPHTSQGPTLDTGLSKNELSQACCVNFFLHRSDFLTTLTLQTLAMSGRGKG